MKGKILLSFVVIVVLFYIGFKIKILKFDNTVNISAILTFMSILVATAAFTVTLNNYNSNQTQYNEQQKQKKEANERTQALNISGWFNSYTTPASDSSLARAKVTIINSSPTPVYQMFIFMVSNKVEAHFTDLKNSVNSDINLIKYLELVKPGETNTEVNAGGNFSGGGHDSVAILFKDTSSVYWYRSNFGTLEKLTSEEVETILQKNHITGPYQQYAD